MRTLCVTPAYGREYNDSTQAVHAWNDGKDFQIRSVGKWMNSYCSNRDTTKLLEDGYTYINIRFNQLRDCVNVVLENAPSDAS